LSKKNKILITGFEPFGGESLNPSQILLEKLQQDSAFSAQADFALLPVSFAQAKPLLEKLLLHNTYDRVFHLGQAGGRTTVCLERVALNWMGGVRDEAGFLPEDSAIDLLAPAAYISDLPLRALSQKLKGNGFPVSISLSAGAFLCNYVYFQSCQILEKQGRGAKALFIHVPYLPDQVKTKPEKPSLEFDLMYESVTEIISDLLLKLEE
jgi:pyroglutamyl-peptidase